MQPLRYGTSERRNARLRTKLVMLAHYKVTTGVSPIGANLLLSF